MLNRQWPGWLPAVRRVMVSFVAGWLGACATPPQPITHASFDRDRLGRIAVVAPQFPPTVLPNKGSGGDGALAGAAGVMAGCAQGGPHGMVFCAPLAGFAALTGVSITSVSAPSAETIARSDERSLRARESEAMARSPR